MNSTGAGSYAEKINMSHFGLNLGQTAEASEMFTDIWLSSIGLIIYFNSITQSCYLLYQ